jgi:Transposase DDE domain
MDLDTLLTTVYVWVDDWYKQVTAGQGQRMGCPPQLSDSEVLTLGVVEQWRVGVPWRSERGMVRYMLSQGRPWFPKMLKASGYNYRFRQLWRWFLGLQQALAADLSQPSEVYEVVDSVPLPAFSLAEGRKSRQRHWLWEAALGDSKAGWFWGHRWLLSILPSGAVTGWTLAPACVQDRWLLQALLSGRALGFIHLAPPSPITYRRPKRQVNPPLQRVGPALATGALTARAYLTDQGFNGAAWLRQWHQFYHASVVCQPPYQSPLAATWQSADRRWLSHHRQLIETVFALLTVVFGIKHLGAHSDWGQLARLAAIAAALNFGIWCNRSLGRSDLALETLLA